MATAVCRPTCNWEMLVPGVCRALVLVPADKYIREGSFQPRLTLNPGLVPTGLLPVWREHNKGTNRASTGVVRIRRIPAGLLPAWQEREHVNRVSTGMTGYQPGFYRCGGRRQREQQINRASTGVMTEFFDGGSNRASTGVGRGCGDIWVGFSGHRFSTRLAEIININKRGYTK